MRTLLRAAALILQVLAMSSAAVSSLKPILRLGALGQGLVGKSAGIRAKDPVPPILLNIDNTYKPENYYMYAQLPAELLHQRAEFAEYLKREGIGSGR